jgi:ABC-type branched-subunit amino acid transport system substrate-binding protein
MLALTRLPDSTDLSQSAVRYDGALSVQIWSPSRLSRGPGLGSAGEFAGQFERLHGYAPGVNAAAAAAAGLALQLGIEQAGSIGPVEVRRALGSLDQETFWGRLAWDVDGRLRDAVVPVLQQRGSDRVIVYPPNLATSRVRYPITDWPRA